VSRNGCDGRLIAWFLITTIRVHLCCFLYTPLGFGTKFTWIVVLKFLLLTYHRSHFLSATLDFTSLFTMAFLGGTYFLYSWAVFGLDFISFCNYMLQSWHITINGCCYLQADICNALNVYHAYFLFKICKYFVYINDFRLIKNTHEAAKCSSFQYKNTSAINRLLSNFQPSWIL